MDLIGWVDFVQYYLISESQGTVATPEPINFNDGNGNIYERDEKSRGFLSTKTNTLKFHNEGADMLLTQAHTKGIAEDVILRRVIKSDDRIDERKEVLSNDFLDIRTLTIDEKASGGIIASAKVGQGGLKLLIDSKAKDEIDLTSLMDIEGNTVDALSTSLIELPPREVFLRSVLVVEDGTEVSAIVGGGPFPDQLNARCFPFLWEVNSDSGNITNVLGDQLNAANDAYDTLRLGNIGNCFVTIAEQDKLIILNGTVRATINRAEQGTCTLDVVVYENGSDFTVKSVTQLDSIDPSILGNVIEYTFVDYEIPLSKGDSLTIGLLSDTQDGIGYTMTDCRLEITEDSTFPITEARCLTYKQAINRLLYLITGRKDVLISDLLTTGELSEDVITEGYWIRGFPDTIIGEDDEERKIQFTLSLDKIIEHIEAVRPIAWGVKFIGDKEYMWLEELEATQQNFIGIRFANTVTNFSTGKKSLQYVEASKVKRSLLSKNFYSKIEIGSSKGGDGYEEVFGLQSVSGKAEFSTINKNGENTYKRLSPFRLGDIDVELARRKPYDENAELDTKYDSDIMCIRAKKLGARFTPKKWQDIYEEAPQNIYRPDSAYNLDLTPARLLLNHSFVINVGLYHYPSANIVFSSSNCNSSLVTKKAGEDYLYEDGLIAHSRLDSPRVSPWKVECSAKVSREIEKNIAGEVEGTENWQGLVAIQIGNQVEYFRLVKSDVNKEGKHIFVESYLI